VSRPSKAPPSLDAQKIAEVIRRINALSRQTSLEAVHAIGALVVREFAGDVARSGAEATGRASYRKLAARGDLQLSASALCRAVGVYALCVRFGGPKTWRHLTPSHLQEILVLGLSRQEEFLRTAEDERWTVARLRAEIAQKRQRRVGRSDRALVRNLRRLKLVTERASTDLTATDTVALDAATVIEMRETVRLLEQFVAKLKALLAPMARVEG